MIIYNNMKNKDWLVYEGGLPKGTIVIMGNEPVDLEVISYLRAKGIRALYSAKLCYQEIPDAVLDAENYKDDITYTKQLGRENRCPILLPENLGGNKYWNYDDFIDGVMPGIVCMERTYNEWKPWELLKFWIRNKYLRDKGIETYMGIWPDSFTGIAKLCRSIQWLSAKIISGNKIFWYSETKSLPEKE